MKTSKFKKTVLGLVIVSTVLGSTIVFSEPGSEKDPLVSLSYLEKKIDQLKDYIDRRLSDVDPKSTNELEVVEVPAGKSLIGKSGTEIVLRGGKAEIIAGQLGGLSDITGGKDLQMGEKVPPNHLLIVPRDDDRGVLVVEDAIFLVRGVYEIR
ncbi:MAG: hypothetical protein GXY96_08010 [Tissierellia bacterium]|nr:hypothetical protein [Tissierellia bacterium]